ncbi:MAG: sigma-70 family RNA polymerase sigma factor [Verrucomicrobiota bacterium]
MDSLRPEQRIEMVQLIAQHQSHLRGFVRSLMIRPEDVDDLVQEVNLVIWEKADQFEMGTSFWAWASQIARLKVMNQVRKYGRNRFIFDDEFLSELAQVAEDRLADLDHRRHALDHCLRSLPTTQRRLLDLRYFEGKSIERVAEETERPAGSIKQTLYRIRTALRGCIEQRLEESPAS